MKRVLFGKAIFDFLVLQVYLKKVPSKLIKYVFDYPNSLVNMVIPTQRSQQKIETSQLLATLSPSKLICVAINTFLIVAILIAIKYSYNWMNTALKQDELPKQEVQIGKGEIYSRIMRDSTLIGFLISRKALAFVFVMLPILFWSTLTLYKIEKEGGLLIVLQAEKWVFISCSWNVLLLTFFQFSLAFLRVRNQMQKACRQDQQGKQKECSYYALTLSIFAFSASALTCCILNNLWVLGRGNYEITNSLIMMGKLVAILLLINYSATALFYGIVLLLIPNRIIEKNKIAIFAILNDRILAVSNPKVKPVIEESHQNLTVHNNASEQLVNQILNQEIIFQQISSVEEKQETSPKQKTILSTQMKKQNQEKIGEPERYQSQFFQWKSHYSLSRQSETENRNTYTQKNTSEIYVTPFGDTLAEISEEKEMKNDNKIGKVRKVGTRENSDEKQKIISIQNYHRVNVKPIKSELQDSSKSSLNLAEIDESDKKMFKIPYARRYKRTLRRGSQQLATVYKNSIEEEEIQHEIEFVDISNYKIKDLGVAKTRISEPNLQFGKKIQKENSACPSEINNSKQKEMDRRSKRRKITMREKPFYYEEEEKQKQFCVLELQNSKKFA